MILILPPRLGWGFPSTTFVLSTSVRAEGSKRHRNRDRHLGERANVVGHEVYAALDEHLDGGGAWEPVAHIPSSATKIKDALIGSRSWSRASLWTPILSFPIYPIERWFGPQKALEKRKD